MKGNAENPQYNKFLRHFDFKLSVTLCVLPYPSKPRQKNIINHSARHIVFMEPLSLYKIKLVTSFG